MTTESQKSLVPWLIVAALAIALWRANSPLPPQPEPTPSKDPAIVAERLIDDTAKGYGEKFSEAAKAVEEKKIVNEEQLYNQLKEGLDSVRSSAASDLDVLLNDNVPTEFGGDGGAAVSTFLRKIASGFLR